MICPHCHESYIWHEGVETKTQAFLRHLEETCPIMSKFFDAIALYVQREIRGHVGVWHLNDD